MFLFNTILIIFLLNRENGPLWLVCFVAPLQATTFPSDLPFIHLKIKYSCTCKIMQIFENLKDGDGGTGRLEGPPNNMEKCSAAPARVPSHGPEWGNKTYKLKMGLLSIAKYRLAIFAGNAQVSFSRIKS